MSITSNANSTFLNVDNAHLRVAGDIHATSVKVGAIEIVPGYSLESTTGIGNTTPHTVEFKNTETSLVTSGDINMLHSSNNAAIKLNSNVVTEFPRSKKLIKYPRVAIPGNNSAVGSGYTFSASDGDYTIKVSSEYDHRFYASNAFDNNLSTFAWLSADSVAGFRYTSGNPITSDSLASSTFAKFGEYGEWIELKLPTSIYLGYVLVYPKDNRVNYLNTSAIVWGSNTGNDGDWQRLSTFTSFGDYSESNPAKIVIDSTVSYNYYAYQITGINSTTASQFSVVSELEYYGIPEYDPDADGTDVVVKSIPNVPNTDWLEVYYDAKDLTSISGTIADLSGKSVTGSLNGNVSIDTLNNVKSFSFDGSGDYISGTLTNTGDFDFTVSTWVFETNDTTTNTVWMIGSGSSSNNPNPSVALAIDSAGSLDFFVFSGIEIRMSNFRDTFGINKWHHIVCTRTGTKLKYFINGIDQGRPVANSDTLSIAANSVFNIGARTGNHLGNNPMHGKIANFRLFNRALTSDEVWQLYAYQKEYFGHGDLSMTLKAGRLGIGTSEPRAALDVRGSVRINDTELTNPVYAEFATNYSTAGLTDEQTTGWRDPSDNILDFNVVTQQSSHNAFDPVGSASVVRGSFTVPVDGVYVVHYAAKPSATFLR
jgi:hypothetical protein